MLSLFPLVQTRNVQGVNGASRRSALLPHAAVTVTAFSYSLLPVLFRSNVTTLRTNAQCVLKAYGMSVSLILVLIID